MILILNVAVCVKQVPGTNEVKINKETNTIVREGVEAVINPLTCMPLKKACA